MKRFLITVGPKAKPRLVFEAAAADWWTAHEQHMELAQLGERIEVRPVEHTDEALAQMFAGELDLAQIAREAGL